MIVPLLIGVLGLGGLAFYRKGILKKGVLTPERRRVFDQAMTKVSDATKLNQLADIFEREGLKIQAKMLRLRAKLRALPADLKAARRKVYRDALKSKNKPAILKLAAAFEKEGATGAAANLRQYAEGL